MFATKLNTSTPTSTPAPAQPGNNNSLFSQKPGGLFNNVNNSGSIGTSTPSPSTGLFGNKPNTTTTTAPSTQPGGLFGNSTNTNNGTNAPGSGLFGNSASTNQPAAGLFGAKPATATNTLSTGGLFGNSFTSNTNTIGSTAGSSLFGNPTTNALNNNNATTGLFGNRPAVGGGLFGNSTLSQQVPPQQTQPQSNPYGLNIGNIPVSVASMPAPIIETTKKGSSDTVKTETTHKPSISKRSFSVSSNVPAPVTNVPHSNLFHKLNSRLHSVKNFASTKGIFSPSWNSSDYLKSSSLSNQRSTSVKDLATLANGSGNIQELRRLNIDTERSAAKKIKLLSGKPVITKLNNEEKSVHNNEELNEAVNNDSTEDVNQPSDNDALITKDTKGSISEEPVLAVDNSNLQDTDYWCSPSPEFLSKLSSTQLKSVPNFIIGRKGFGNISFNYDVDLTAFSPHFRQELFGNIVSFYSTKTVEVYPDHNNKPAVGCGLNVPATISLEKIYPIDKKTKRPITDTSKTDEMQVLIRKLKSMRDMEFISYNPFGGVWTFKVNHFSIWGLVNDEDAEVGEDDITAYKQRADSPAYGTIKPFDNRQLVPVGSGNQSNDDFVMNDSEIGLNADIIEEKQYEPDVMEQDFEALEAAPDLNISKDWITQLKLAGSNEHTIFIEEKYLKSMPARITDVLNKFDEEREVDKQISKNLKLTTGTNFAKILYNNSILIKDRTSPCNASIRMLKSELGDKFNIQKELFQKHITSSTIEQRKLNDLPQITNFDLRFQDILQVVPSTDLLYNIWELCSILFDDILLPYDVNDAMVKNTLIQKARHQNLCRWLQNNIAGSLANKDSNFSDPLERVFLSLVKNDVIEATKLAIASNNKHLAVLISCLGSNDPRIRELSSLQLSTWKSNGQSVDSRVKKIYQLLSGDLFNDVALVSTLIEQYGWLGAFSLAIFYGQIDEMPLEELVESHLFIIEKSDNLFLPGIFKIFSQQGNVDALIKEISTTSTDVNNTNNNVNVQFLWYLIQILVSKSHRHVSESLRDTITLLYVDQLKLLGCSVESLYVALFINADKVAEQTLETILDHTVPTVWNDPMSGTTILEKLQIPKKNIYGSLALYEKYLGNYIKETEYLIHGGLFDQAGELICKEVGPKLILSYNEGEDIEYLNTLNEFIKKIPKSECPALVEELSVFTQFSTIISASKKKETNEKDITTLQRNVKTYYEKNKHFKIIPACCNIINKRLEYLTSK